MTAAPGDDDRASASDAALARRIAAGGDAAAEAELCRRFGPRVRLYGLRHLRDELAADDLVQHVLTVTLTRLRRQEVADPDRIASFVLGTARLAAMDLRRAEARWREQTGLQAEQLPGPEQTTSYDHERLLQCLRTLAERERTVVLLTFYDGSSAPDIGSRLGLQPGNVRVIRLRAIARLRDCMTNATREEAS